MMDDYTPDYYCPDCNAGFGDTRTTCAYCGEPLCITPRIQYVNVYRVELAYGGPEEGGWWVDMGTPEASVPFDSRADKDGVREDTIKAELATLFPNPGNKSSVAGNAHNILILTEYHQAKAWPEVFPHYE